MCRRTLAKRLRSREYVDPCPNCSHGKIIDALPAEHRVNLGVWTTSGLCGPDLPSVPMVNQRAVSRRDQRKPAVGVVPVDRDPVRRLGPVALFSADGETPELDCELVRMELKGRRARQGVRLDPTTQLS